MLLDLARYKRLLILFIGCIALFVILFAAYDLVTVEPMATTNNNLQAFPRIQPKDLPDANISLSKCINDIQVCTNDLDCESCDETGKFRCTRVERDGQYEINGVRLRKGSYCLPRTDSAPKCNQYTGKWVWSTASDCPPDADGRFSNQCWKCVCLYPDLFYDTKDCSTQIACINTTDKTLQSPEEQRPRNRLKGAPYSEFAGQYWDPNSIDASGSSALDSNPYATDAKGRPKFYCECDARDDRNNKEFLLLPNDPYTCHVDMCYNLGQKLTTTYSCKNSANQPCDPFETPENCTCSCNCSLSQNTTRADGTCQVVQGLCNPGYINNSYTGCECGNYLKRQCRSNQKNQTNTALPPCKNLDNPFGEECVDPCASKPCGTNGVCFLADNTRGYECRCNFPNTADAEGNAMNWSTTDDLASCAGEKMCSYGNTVRYAQQGWPGQWAGSDDVPVKLVDKQSQIQCCIPGKLIYDFNNELSDPNDYAKLRCLKKEEKDGQIGQWIQEGVDKVQYGIFGAKNTTNTRGQKVVPPTCNQFQCYFNDSKRANYNCDDIGKAYDSDTRYLKDAQGNVC